MDQTKYLPLVSIVVVTLNRSDLLRHCLESIAKQNYKNIDPIVVDNGSIEDIKHCVQNVLPEARYIRLETNLGFAEGNNQGIRLAKGDYIALLNNDAIAEPEWLSAMVRLAEQDRRLGALATVVIDGNNTDILDSCGVGVALDGMSRQMMHGMPVPRITSPREVPAVSGCACMFRSEALKQVGLFDSTFFAYCEDTDLSLRLRRAGWTIELAPEARVKHNRSSTSGVFSKKKVFWIERNHFWVALKNFPILLLMLLPLMTAWRYMVQIYLWSHNDSELGSYAKASGYWSMISIIIRAHISILLQTPRILAKRFQTRGTTIARNTDILKMLWRYRLSMLEVLGARSAVFPSRRNRRLCSTRGPEK